MLVFWGVLFLRQTDHEKLYLPNALPPKKTTTTTTTTTAETAV